VPVRGQGAAPPWPRRPPGAGAPGARYGPPASPGRLSRRPARPAPWGWPSA